MRGEALDRSMPTAARTVAGGERTTVANAFRLAVVSLLMWNILNPKSPPCVPLTYGPTS